MAKPRIKKYLLFLMGNFSSIEDVLKDMTETIAVVMDGKHLRYIHHDNLVICHFESREDLDDINEFLDTSLSDMYESYFLIIKPKRMGTRLDDDLNDHLFNLSDIKKRTRKKPTTEVPRIKEMIEGFANELKEKFKEEINKPPNFNLDDVLDKISAHGMESLSEAEKYFLKNLPK